VQVAPVVPQVPPEDPLLLPSAVHTPAEHPAEVSGQQSALVTQGLVQKPVVVSQTEFVPNPFVASLGLQSALVAHASTPSPSLQLQFRPAPSPWS
jgi:hypothetical protein